MTIEIQVVDANILGITSEPTAITGLIKFRLVKGSPTVHILCPRFQNEPDETLRTRMAQYEHIARHLFKL